MSAEIGIRLTKPSDYASVHALVQTIADETFADLFASQVPIGEANWGSACGFGRGDRRRDEDAGHVGQRLMDTARPSQNRHRWKAASTS
jgi:hypothetical protein